MTQDESITGRFVATVGDILVHHLTADHVERWFLSLGSAHLCRDGRVRPEVKATTYNFYYARLKAFVHYLQARGMTRHDPMAHIRPRLDIGGNRTRLLPGPRSASMRAARVSERTLYPIAATHAGPSAVNGLSLQAAEAGTSKGPLRLRQTVGQYARPASWSGPDSGKVGGCARSGTAVARCS